MLGADASTAAQLFEVTDAGTFEHGASTLQLRADPDDPEQYEAIRAALRKVRDDRPQPGRDDKVVAAWNGLAIAALAEAGVAIDRRYLDAARAAPNFCSTCMSSTAGCVARRATEPSATRWPSLRTTATSPRGCSRCTRRAASVDGSTPRGELLDIALARFAAPDGGFFDTGDDAEQLVRRPRDPSDNAAPSGSSALAAALLTYSALTGSTRTATRQRMPCGS